MAIQDIFTDKKSITDLTEVIKEQKVWFLVHKSSFMIQKFVIK